MSINSPFSIPVETNHSVVCQSIGPSRKVAEMRFLSVAERELRAAARQKGTYRLRWITAVAFFGLLVWMTWVFDGFSRRGETGSTPIAGGTQSR